MDSLPLRDLIRHDDRVHQNLYSVFLPARLPKEIAPYRMLGNDCILWDKRVSLRSHHNLPMSSDRLHLGEKYERWQMYQL